MSFLEIRKFPDPVLREVAKPVEDVTGDIVKLANDMIETMRLSQGAGLAANQVGIPIRLIVLDEETKNRRQQRSIVVVNPVIVEKTDEEVAEEGCLSVPKFYEYVKRSKSVLIQGTTLEGNPFELECQGRTARAFQHEIDHLDGVLFIDHLSPVKRNIFKKKYVAGK